jgi:hypothetical protein
MFDFQRNADHSSWSQLVWHKTKLESLLSHWKLDSSTPYISKLFWGWKHFLLAGFKPAIPLTVVSVLMEAFMQLCQSSVRSMLKKLSYQPRTCTCGFGFIYVLYLKYFSFLVDR